MPSEQREWCFASVRVPAVEIERVRDRVAKAGVKPGEAARAVKWARKKNPPRA